MTSLETIQDLLRPLFPGYMGVEVTGITAERVAGQLVVRPELCTAGGILHGGAYMAFADTLGAVATLANLPPGTRTTTIESKTNFLGSAPVGTTVSAECTPLHRGRTTMVWQTTIRSQAGKPCAVVLQTQLVIAG
jgi:uncharacterized protein (TIGR00369 family)